VLPLGLMMRDFEHQVDEFSISKGYKLETA
jgi:hypothetical protein